MTSFDEAQRAKRAVKGRLTGDSRLASIGVGKEGDDFVVVVYGAYENPSELPAEEEGVRVVLKKAERPSPF